MKIDFIPLANVPTVESLTDSAKVLVIDSGEVKKTAVSNVGGGGFVDSFFHTQARVTLNVTGAGDAPLARILSSSMWDFIGITNDEGSWDSLEPTGEFTVSNGQLTMAFFGIETAGFYIESPANWEITVASGDAVVETEEESSWVTITGDCVINAKFIG